MVALVPRYGEYNWLFILSIMLNLTILALAVADFIKNQDYSGRIKVLNWTDGLLILGPAIMWTYMEMNVANSSSDNSVDFGAGLVLLWLSFVAKVVADKRIVKAVVRSACCRALNNPRSRFNRQVHGCLDDLECCIVWEGLTCLNCIWDPSDRPGEPAGAVAAGHVRPGHALARRGAGRGNRQVRRRAGRE